MIGSRRFGDSQLERLFQAQQSLQSAKLILHAISVLVAAFLLLAVNHLFNPDLALILGLIGASSGIIFQIFLYKGSFENKLSVTNFTVLWLFCIIIGIIPAGGQSSLVPSLIAQFLLYSLYSYDLLTTVFFAVFLSIIQVIGFICLPIQAFTIHKLLATLLVHAWCHFVGIYLYITRNRLCRAAFLNARNALSSHAESAKAANKMNQLLGSALPEHVIAAVRNQLGVGVPQLYIEHYSESTVIYARLYGFETILSQLSVQDAARLLNEFNARIDHLVQKNKLIRVQSDAIIVVSGILERRITHAEPACQFAWELIHLLRSFCDATTVQLYVKAGVASGSVSAGIIGMNKWHYDVVGDALNTAVGLEKRANPNCILLSSDTAEAVKKIYSSEKFDENSWRLIPTARVATTIPNALLFPIHRRYSLTTVSQAIGRLLHASSVTSVAEQTDSVVKCTSGSEKTLPQGHRKQKLINHLGSKVEEGEEESGIINAWTLKFNDIEVEKSFNMVIDRWFIPALAISIFFLVVYGLYQILVLPRLIASLATIIITLAAMFIILLMLYVNLFEKFCYFITRTSLGHIISILLILALLFVSGIINVFSCPSDGINNVCQDIFYSVVSCVLWMLATTVFVRFNAIGHLFTVAIGIGIYCVQIFVTHSTLYVNYSILVGWRVEYDLLIALGSFALIIYIQARRNERIIRMDFLSLFGSMEESSQLEIYDRINAQILMNALPHHIAYNYLYRTDLYCHMCHSVGILSIKIGQFADWNGETGLNRLNDLIHQIDRLLENYPGLEKVRNSNCIYTTAVGVLPEITRNVHDTPFTIGDLLASLTSFAISVTQVIESEGLNVSMGMDCGTALSVVVGVDRPRYEVIGPPCNRAIQLMESAENYGIVVVSEEIYLALRPRNFRFNDKHPITVAPNLSGYTFTDVAVSAPKKFANPLFREATMDRICDSSADFHNLDEEMTRSTSVQLDEFSSCPPLDPQHFSSTIPNGAKSVGVTAHNPLEMFSSMNSSISSDVFSIDISVESDSEIEWITPESHIYEKQQEMFLKLKDNVNSCATTGSRKFWPSMKSFSYESDEAKPNSDFCEDDRPSFHDKLRNKRFKPSRNGPRIPNWLSSRSSVNSELSAGWSKEGSVSALSKLNAAARRVDKMLRELAHVDGNNGNLQEKPFPTSFTGLSTSTRSVNVDSRRDVSSACNTDYDNAESEGAYSDPEIACSSKQQELNHMLRGFRSRSKANDKKQKQNKDKICHRRPNRLYDPGNDADIDSNCSTTTSSTILDKLRWKSVHSIGYENEYEFASDIDEQEVTLKLLKSPTQLSKTANTNSVGADEDFLHMDASDPETEKRDFPSTQNQVEALTQDIYKSFGEYQLSTFSDMDASF